MGRNRLEELQAASKHAPITEEEEMEPLNRKGKKKKAADPAGVGDDFQSFLDRMEKVVSWVDQVEKNTLEMRSLQKKLLASTHKDEANERRLDDLVAENKRLAGEVRSTLKAEQEWCEKKAAESPRKRSPQAAREWQMRKTQVSAQSRRFFDVWAEYNNDQIEFHERSKKLFVKRCKITGVTLTDEEIEERIHERDTAMFARGILDQERLAKQQLTELETRHEDFLKLEKSIQEVHDMFVEVGTLVQQQGEMIDKIEHNVLLAQADVEKGKGELQEAEKNQKAARKKKVCLFSVLAVVLAIVLVVVLAEFDVFSGGGGGGDGGEIKEVHHYHEVSASTSSPAPSQPPEKTASPVAP